jgi:MFS family permease
MNAIARNIKAYFGEFGSLLKLPREFWAIQALNLFWSLAYFAIATFGSVHMSQDAGFSDEGAGLVLSTFLTGTAIIMILMGPVLDKYGYRKVTLYSMGIMGIGIIGIGATPLFFGATMTSKVLIVVFYVVIALGNGMASPVIMAGTKRFTNSSTQTVGFNAWYLFMQIGGVLLVIIDPMRRTLADKPTPEQLEVFRSAGGNSHIMFFMAAMVGISWLIVFLFLKNEDQFPEFVQGGDVTKKPKPEPAPRSQVKFSDIISRIKSDPTFRKICAFLLLTIPAHLPFVMVFVLYPKYYLRVLGSETPIGGLNAINPAVIMAGLILFAPLVKKFNVYWVLTIGMIVGTGSVLLLAIPPQWVAGILGTDLDSAYKAMILTQIVIFAIGEMIWSPQLQTYVGSVTPPGMEGTYMSVSRVPYTTAKLLAGGIGGFLIANFCPEGVRTSINAGTLSYWEGPEAMMLITALFGLITPVSVLLLKKWFYVESKAGDAI